MEKFVKRLIVEHKELIEKRNKLSDFLKSEKSNKLIKSELLIMGAQLVTMDTYIAILEKRLFIHNIQVEKGLYKKFITEYDMIEDEDEDEDSKDNDETPRPSDCDMFAGRKNNVEDIKYE